MEKAKWLLDNEFELTIEDISDRCGFEHSSSFYHAFKKAFGLTPAEYRKGGMWEKGSRSKDNDRALNGALPKSALRKAKHVCVTTKRLSSLCTKTRLYLHERVTVTAKRVSLVSAKRFVFKPFSCKEWRDKHANWSLLTKEGAELMRFLVQLFSVKPFKCCVLGQTNP